VAKLASTKTLWGPSELQEPPMVGTPQLCRRGTAATQVGRAQPAQRKSLSPWVSKVRERKVASWPKTVIKGDPTAKLGHVDFGKGPSRAASQSSEPSYTVFA